MNFTKHKWSRVKLGKVCDFKNGFNFNKGSLTSGLKVINVFDFQNNFSPKYDSLESLVADRVPSDEYLLKPHDILFVRSNGNKELVGRTLYINEVPFPLTFSAFCIRGRFLSKDISSKFYTYYFKSDIFKTSLKSIVQGTNINNLSQGLLSNVTIPLPPLSEQTQIAELFQNLEDVIEQTRVQEINLRKLCKNLINEFISDKPCFGNLLKGKKLIKVNYSDVAEKIFRKIDPVNYGIERIVGGENLESEDFKIRNWGTVGKDFLGPAFHVLFKPGDILYGSRRTYLRKVALADFEGVCANTTYVIQAKKDVLLQDLLKHIMLSEKFTQHSIGVSKGSTNPYINWKDLDNFTFQIPDLDTQRKIAAVLDEILEVAEQCREQGQTLRKLKQKLLNEILG